MEVSEYVSLLRRDAKALEFARLVEGQLLDFVCDKEGNEYAAYKALQYPHLSSYLRLLIHTTARSFNLRTGSRGFGEERFTVVSLSDDTWLPLLTLNELVLPARKDDVDVLKKEVERHTLKIEKERVRTLKEWKREQEESRLKNKNQGNEGGENENAEGGDGSLSERPLKKQRGRGSVVFDRNEGNGGNDSRSHDMNEEVEEGTFGLDAGIFKEYVGDERTEREKQRDRYNSERDGPNSKNWEGKHGLLSHFLVFEDSEKTRVGGNTEEKTVDLKEQSNWVTKFGPKCLGVRRCYDGDDTCIAIFGNVEDTAEAKNLVEGSRTLGEFLRGRASVVGSRMGVSRRPASKAGNPMMLQRVLKGIGVDRK
eukprot:comp59136_c0_seq1/m.47836 comp59136_c0_seq1/g.47836  ORF comp59136_c0_seq1/g.47836 comp59136_c0_seq1/m.47836 type:complete len:367 (-) comp59136_c0_seq1:690-1790(-)